MAHTVKQRRTVMEAVDALNSIDTRDPERAHGTADNILLALLRELGAGSVTDAYNALVARYPWWA